MKLSFRLRSRKKNLFKRPKKSKHTVSLFNHHRPEPCREIVPNECQPLSNNMAVANEGGGDERGQFWQQIPTPVDEQQIANAQNKVDRLMHVISDAYEKTLVRNLRLEELDMRSTDLFRDAEKMKNMAHKMQDKFFWEDSESASFHLFDELRIVVNRSLLNKQGVLPLHHL
jgi:hypothetical protein